MDGPYRFCCQYPLINHLASTVCYQYHIRSRARHCIHLSWFQDCITWWIQGWKGHQRPNVLIDWQQKWKGYLYPNLHKAWRPGLWIWRTRSKNNSQKPIIARTLGSYPILCETIKFGSGRWRSFLQTKKAKRITCGLLQWNSSELILCTFGRKTWPFWLQVRYVING